MRVSSYIAMLVAACFLAGSILACEIVWRRQVVSQLAEAGERATALAARTRKLAFDVRNVEVTPNQTSDARGRALARGARSLAASPYAAGARKQLESIAFALDRLRSETAPTRKRVELELALEEAQLVLDRRSEQLTEALVVERARTTEWILGASSLYGLLLCLCWWLSMQFLLRPMRELGHALRRGPGECTVAPDMCDGASESRELVEAVASYASGLSDSLACIEDDSKRQIDELATINRAKSEFLASMSHEIRTPMTAILGYADLLDRPNLEGRERADCLEVIQRNGAQLLDVINDILDVSKIEAGKMTLESVPSDSTATIAEVLAQLRHKAEAKSIRIETVYRDAVPDRIQTDPTRFRQVIANVVSNAIALCGHEGRIRVEIGMSADQEAAMEVAVCASDIGLPREEVAALFDPFAQGDAVAAPAGAARLGLAIARRLAELLGGQLELLIGEDRVGEDRACELRFSLPVDLETDADMVQGPPDFVDILSLDIADDDDIDLSDLRVMLVEDGIDNQELISMHLRDAGAEVFIAGTAEIGLEEIARATGCDASYHVVLMDMFLPGMNGCEAIALLRAQGNNVPIIMLTASDNPEERDTCLSVGADEFVTKPVDRRTLAEAIDAQLDRSDMSSTNTLAGYPANV